MTENLLAGGRNTSSGGWDETPITNPFDTKGSSSTLSNYKSNSNISLISGTSSSGSIGGINTPKNNDTVKPTSARTSKQRKTKKHQSQQQTQQSSSSIDPFLTFDTNPFRDPVPTSNHVNNDSNGTIHNSSSNNNNNNSGIDDLLDLFAPATTISPQNQNTNQTQIQSNTQNQQNKQNQSINPFIDFDGSFDINNNNNNNNNGNDSNTNANGNTMSPFDFFEPQPSTQQQQSTSTTSIVSNSSSNESSNIIKNKSKDKKKTKKRKSSKNTNTDSDSDNDSDSYTKSRSKSDYSTDTSSDDDISDDEKEGGGTKKRKSIPESLNHIGNSDDLNTTSIAPPPQRRSSRKLDNKSNKKRHSAPVGDIESVSNQLKSEGLIPEHKIGVDPRSPGVGHRIRNEKAVQDQANKPKRRPAGDGAPTVKPDTKAPGAPKSKKSKSDKAKSFDVLPELKRGTALLKYGRRGWPHFRQFNLSEDNTAILWFSQKKKLDKSSIKMKDIDDVITGQHTKQFDRVKWTTLTPASFSILYDNSKRSLDLVAKSVDEMKMWVEALRYLRNEAKKGNDLSKIKKVFVSVDFRDRNRPQSRAHSGNFLRSHETKDKEVNSELKNKLVSDINNLRNLYNEVEKEANNEVVQASHEFVSISQILSEIEERIGELDKEVRNTRNTKIAENDVWRTKIDLEALRDKIRVLYKNNKGAYYKAKGRRWSVF